jgi:hypothetical protein
MFCLSPFAPSIYPWTFLGFVRIRQFGGDSANLHGYTCGAIQEFLTLFLNNDDDDNNNYIPKNVVQPQVTTTCDIIR